MTSLTAGRFTMILIRENKYSNSNSNSLFLDEIWFKNIVLGLYWLFHNCTSEIILCKMGYVQLYLTDLFKKHAYEAFLKDNM